MKNILFLVIDCLGYKFLAGAKRRRYPYLDYLFNQGTSFAQAIATSVTTSPSISSILTGCYPFRHGVRTLRSHFLSDSVRTLAESLNNIGYSTYAEVTGPLLPQLRLSRGFTQYNYRDRSSYLHSGWGTKFKERLSHNYYKEPWLIFLHLWELHYPRQVVRQYRNSDYTTPYENALRCLDSQIEQLFKQCIDMNKTFVIVTGDHGEQPEKNELDRKFKAAFQIIADKCIERGIATNRWFRLFRKYHIGHGYNICEDLVRVPLLLVDRDKLPKGKEYDFQVSHVDMFPTILALLGASPSSIHADGHSVLPCLKQGIGDREHIAYMQACRGGHSSVWLEGIRYRGLKYTKYQQAANGFQEWLYNLHQDPEEKSPLNNEALVGMMRTKLRELKEGCDSEVEATKMSHEATSIMAKKLRELGYM